MALGVAKHLLDLHARSVMRYDLFSRCFGKRRREHPRLAGARCRPPFTDAATTIADDSPACAWRSSVDCDNPTSVALGARQLPVAEFAGASSSSAVKLLRSDPMQLVRVTDQHAASKSTHIVPPQCEHLTKPADAEPGVGDDDWVAVERKNLPQAIQEGRLHERIAELLVRMRLCVDDERSPIEWNSRGESAQPVAGLGPVD